MDSLWQEIHENIEYFNTETIQIDLLFQLIAGLELLTFLYHSDSRAKKNTCTVLAMLVGWHKRYFIKSMWAGLLTLSSVLLEIARSVASQELFT